MVGKVGELNMVRDVPAGPMAPWACRMRPLPDEDEDVSSQCVMPMRRATPIVTAGVTRWGGMCRNSRRSTVLTA